MRALRARSARRGLVVGLGGAGALFLSIPLAALVVRWLGSGRGLEALGHPAAASAIGLTVGTTSASLAFIVLFGTPLAYLLARESFPGRRLLQAAVDLPMVLPPAVAGLALLLAFGRRGFLGGSLGSLGIELAFTTTAVVMAQCFVAGPLYIRAAAGAFARVDRDLEEAARVSGASDWAVFRWITAPLARAGLAAGATLAWARAVGEFGATILFAGNLQGRSQTMSLAVYSALEIDLDLAVGLAVILLGVSAVLLVAMRVFRVDL